MKKQYQIEQQRAVQQFRRIATEQNPNIQMILPLTEIVGLLQQGVGNLLRETGLALMQAVMEEEVRHLAGERHEQHEGRRASRWGKEDGYCVVDGQKVPIRRTRLRTAERREQRLGSYELFQRSGPMQLGVWDKMMRGLSTLGIPIRRGRAFDPSDQHRAVISESLAGKYWNGEDPIGKLIRVRGESLEIIGICGDTHLRPDPSPILYREWLDEPDAAHQVDLWSSEDPLALAHAVEWFATWAA